EPSRSISHTPPIAGSPSRRSSAAASACGSTVMPSWLLSARVRGKISATSRGLAERRCSTRAGWHIARRTTSSATRTLLAIEVVVADHALTEAVDQQPALLDRQQLLAQRLLDA